MLVGRPGCLPADPLQTANKKCQTGGPQISRDRPKVLAHGEGFISRRLTLTNPVLVYQRLKRPMEDGSGRTQPKLEVDKGLTSHLGDSGRSPFPGFPTKALPATLHALQDN